MQVKVTKQSATDSKKDGTKLVNKFGKAYWRVGIQVGGQEGWVNGFMPFKPDWEGKMVDLELYEEEYNGEMQKKFRVPKSVGIDGEKIEKILNILVSHKILLEEIKMLINPKKKNYPSAEDEGIDTDNVFEEPF